MTWHPPDHYVCYGCGRQRPCREEAVASTIEGLNAVGLSCSYCGSVTFVQLVQTDSEDAATTSTPLSPLPEGAPTGDAAAGPPRLPASPAAAPVTVMVHNCEDCGSGWQRDYAGAHWGRCFVLEMRTPARGAGCKNNWTARMEGHGGN